MGRGEQVHFYHLHMNACMCSSIRHTYIHLISSHPSSHLVSLLHFTSFPTWGGRKQSGIEKTKAEKKKKKKGRRKNRTENIRLILFICRCVPIHLSIHRILLPRRPLQILMGLVERLRHVLAGFLRWENSSQHPLLPSPPGTGLKRRWSGRRTHQLFQVPAADLHVAAVVVETLGEVPRVGLAGRGAPGAAALHLTVSVLGLNESVCGSLLWGSLFGSRSASATELQSTPQPSVSPAVLSRPVQCGGGERERERERGADSPVRRFRPRRRGRCCCRRRLQRLSTPSVRTVPDSAAPEPTLAPPRAAAPEQYALAQRQWTPAVRRRDGRRGLARDWRWGARRGARRDGRVLVYVPLCFVLRRRCVSVDGWCWWWWWLWWLWVNEG